MMAQPADGHSGGGSDRRAPRSPANEHTTAPPAPLPTDPQLRAEILAGIERGLAQARAGIGHDLDDVLAEMDRKIAAHQK